MDSAYDRFLAEINCALNAHAPARQIKIPSHKFRREPWFSRGLQTSSRHLSKLHSKACAHGVDSRQHNEYVQYRNAYNSLKRTAKRNYYDALFVEHKDDPRATWRVLNGPTKGRTRTTDQVEKLVIGDNEISDPREVANSFAEFFANVGPNQARALTPIANAPNNPRPPLERSTPTPQSIFLLPVVDEEIIRIIDGLKSKKSVGLDEISTRFVKKL